MSIEVGRKKGGRQGGEGGEGFKKFWIKVES